MGDQSKKVPAEGAMPSVALTPDEVERLLPELDRDTVQAKFAPLLDNSLGDSLSADERAALQRDDALGYALFSPLPAQQVDAMTSRLLQEIGVPTGVERPQVATAVTPPDRAATSSLDEARVRRHRRMRQATLISGPLLAMALAAGLLLFPMAAPPQYDVTAQVSRPATTLSNSEPQPDPGRAPIAVSPEQILTLQLNPRKALHRTVELRAFVERSGQLAQLPIMVQQTDGAFLLRQSFGTLFGAQATGRINLWLVVGSSRALPKSTAQFDELRRTDPQGHAAGLFIDQRTYDLNGPAPSP